MTIVEYSRPETLDEVLRLLGQEQPHSLPLAGGTVINRRTAEDLRVVDLQMLGLDQILTAGNNLEIGAMATLQSLLESQIQPALKTTIQREATYNLRQVATVAGTLVASDGRSAFTTALLALDAMLTIQPGGERIGLGDLLPLRQEVLRGRLITQVSLPINARLAFEAVARTPADLPIVCAAAAAWPSGRLRLALGGYGQAAKLAFDGTEAGGAEFAARSAYNQAADEWASAEYRQEIAGVLARRVISQLVN
jgi:CO/xanthine dehydrogenase FAD-binding subunit